LSPEQIARYTGEVELQSGRTVEIGTFEGSLTVNFGSGAFRLLPEDDTRFRMEDTHDPVILDLDDAGRVVRVWAEQLAYLEAADAVKLGRPEQAVAAVVAAAERFPESARLQYNVARGLIGTGRSGEALEYLAAALRIDPGLSDAKSLRRRVLARRYGWILGLPVLALVLWVGVRRVRRAHRSRW
jgi:tetratricopeptide (TPR) repeat protein